MGRSPRGVTIVVRRTRHGRIEKRTLQTSTAINEFVTFPHVGQVFRLTRKVSDLLGNKQRTETVYGVTSLSPDKASAEELLGYVRQHWSIENSLHWVRDVTFDEDRSQVRVKNGPRVLATLNNLAIGLLNLIRVRKTIAAGIRYCANHTQRTLQFIGLA